MPEADFDVDGLAAYLHLLPQQVARMADRGNLPGRKVAGQWRFSKAEIHHWLEERIGAIEDDAELAEMEGVLRRGAGDSAKSDSIADLLSPDRIAVLGAKTQRSVIDLMIKLADSTGLLWDPEKMADAVRQRESMQSTALDCGVALLHPRRPMPSILSQAFIVLGKTVQGIPFGSQRGQLTDIFFLLCSDSDAEHLQTLARISRLIGDAGILQAMRAAQDANEIYNILVAAEDDLSKAH